MRKILIGAAVATLNSAARLGAQAADSGYAGQFSLSVGIGRGSLGATAKAGSGALGSTLPAHAATMLMFRVGYEAAPRQVIGAEYDGWSRTINGQSSSGTPTHFTQTARWYLVTAQEYVPITGVLGGFYGEGGVGACIFKLFGKQNTTALGGGLGVGYDVRIIKGLALSPYVEYLASMKTEVEHTGTSVSTHALLYGVALTLH